MSLCAHRHPDGSYCKRHASADSRFCYRHEQHWRSPDEPDRHDDVHPLARLATRQDVFNVVRESLNAVRLGRISPGQAYAVGYLADLWLRFDRVMLDSDRRKALENQCLPELVEAERDAESRRRTPLPLPVKIDQPAAMAQLNAIAEPLILKPASDYPGEPGYIPPPDPLVDEVDASPPVLSRPSAGEGRTDSSTGLEPRDDRGATAEKLFAEVLGQFRSVRKRKGRGK